MRAAALLCLLLSSCATIERGEPARCAPGLDRWILTELYFGQAWPQGIIAEEQWQEFVAREIVPRLPEGFTIIPVEGAWRSPDTGRLVREPTRVVRRLRKPGADPDLVFAEIVAAYKTRFIQDSVLRVDADVCAAF